MFLFTFIIVYLGSRINDGCTITIQSRRNNGKFYLRCRIRQQKDRNELDGMAIDTYTTVISRIEREWHFKMWKFLKLPKRNVCVRRFDYLKNIFFETDFKRGEKKKSLKLKMCQVFVCWLIRDWGVVRNFQIQTKIPLTMTCTMREFRLIHLVCVPVYVGISCQVLSLFVLLSVYTHTLWWLQWITNTLDLSLLFSFLFSPSWMVRSELNENLLASF